jgi:hypothetical protein
VLAALGVQFLFVLICGLSKPFEDDSINSTEMITRLCVCAFGLVGLLTDTGHIPAVAADAILLSVLYLSLIANISQAWRAREVTVRQIRKRVAVAKVSLAKTEEDVAELSIEDIEACDVGSQSLIFEECDVLQLLWLFRHHPHVRALTYNGHKVFQMGMTWKGKDTGITFAQVLIPNKQTAFEMAQDLDPNFSCVLLGECVKSGHNPKYAR